MLDLHARISVCRHVADSNTNEVAGHATFFVINKVTVII